MHSSMPRLTHGVSLPGGCRRVDGWPTADARPTSRLPAIASYCRDWSMPSETSTDSPSSMPKIDPPAVPLGPPVVDRIPAGTLLWRVHSNKYLANQRNPTPSPTIPGGGRFDSLDGSYSYSYFGQSEERGTGRGRVPGSAP